MGSVMGMYDTIMAKRGDQDIEVQVKVYMGRYEPGCKFYEMGELIPDPDFPKIRFAEWGYADSGDCIVEFDGGRVVRIFWPPDTKGYKFPELPRPKHKPGRKEAVALECERRMRERTHDMSLEEALLAPIKRAIDYPGFARLIFTKGNYTKIGGKWQRIRPI